MALPKEIAHYVSIYVKHARGKLSLLFLITLIGGFVEMLGITMLLPILNLSFETTDSDDAISQAIQQSFGALGIPITLNNILITIVIVFIIKGIMIFLQKYYTAVIALNLRKKLQISIAKATANVNYATFSKINAGNLTNILTKETAGFASSFSEFSRMGSCLAYIMFYMLAFVALKPDIILILFFATGIIYIALKGLTAKTKKLSVEVTKNYGQVSNKTIEVLHNYIYLKATDKLRSYIKHVTDYIEAIQKNERKLMFYASLVTAIKEPIAVLALVILIFYQVSMMGQPITEIIIIGLILYRMLNQVLLLQGQWQRFNSYLGSLEIIEDTISSFEQNKEIAGKKHIDHIPMPITLDKVSFSHGDNEVLKDISITINDKQTIGIVGPSGSGKTTLFHLVTGLITPNNGRVVFGNIPYEEIDKNDIRKKIGYISQDTAIFTGTIRDNLVLDNDNIPLEKIKTALEEASCPDFIDMLDKEVGDQGKNLSGGQKQRISIARELLKDPEMIIFDEATSALDSLSDKIIRQTIANMQGKRTILIITHRLQSVETCDNIYVLNQGNLIEQGKFKELLKNKKSFFYDMYHKQ